MATHKRKPVCSHSSLFIGPFVDAEDFYMTQQVPAVEKVETYRQETDFVCAFAHFRSRFESDMTTCC